MKCVRGQHEWLDEVSARRCCRPEWERVSFTVGQEPEGLDPAGIVTTAVEGIRHGWVLRRELQAPAVPLSKPARAVVRELTRRDRFANVAGLVVIQWMIEEVHVDEHSQALRRGVDWCRALGGGHRHDRDFWTALGMYLDGAADLWSHCGAIVQNHPKWVSELGELHQQVFDLRNSLNDANAGRRIRAELLRQVLPLLPDTTPQELRAEVELWQARDEYPDNDEGKDVAADG